MKRGFAGQKELVLVFLVFCSFLLTFSAVSAQEDDSAAEEASDTTLNETETDAGAETETETNAETETDTETGTETPEEENVPVTSSLDIPPPPDCGDGVTDANAGEKCDDGGVVNGDGCSANCELEKPEITRIMLDTDKETVTLKWSHFDELFSETNEGTGAGGNAVLDAITGNAVASANGEKIGFFTRIINFFKWLFGARKAVGVQRENYGYVVYRMGESVGGVSEGEWEETGFAGLDSCTGSTCTYEEDVSELSVGEHYYAVSVIFGGWEGEKSEKVSINIPRIGEALKISPSNKQYIKTGNSIQFTANGGDGDYKWEIIGDCGGVDDSGLFIAEKIGTCMVMVTDSLGETELSDTITVEQYTTDNRNPPFLNPPEGIGNKVVPAGEKLSIQLRGEDLDNNDMTYSAERLNPSDWSAMQIPNNAVFDTDKGKFEWETEVIDRGNYIFNFSVSDGIYSDSEIVYVNVHTETSDICISEGDFAPYGACFERKPLYCDPVEKTRLNCSDCGCPKSKSTILSCYADGRCGVPSTCEDLDGDGIYGMGGGCPEGAAMDCDDYDANINPYAVEVCGDLQDNNCDGIIDEAGCRGGRK